MSNLGDFSGNDLTELAARIRDGDELAYAELVERYLEPLTRFAFSFTRDESAHDVVQEIFVRIWSLGPRWNPPGSIVAYLFASVRNRAVDLARSDRVNQRVLNSIQQDAHEEYADPALVSDALLTSYVRNEIAALTERQREALRLRYNYGHSVPQIAQILGVNTKSAEKLLSRGLGALRERLRKFRDER